MTDQVVKRDRQCINSYRLQNQLEEIPFFHVDIIETNWHRANTPVKFRPRASHYYIVNLGFTGILLLSNVSR